MAYEPKDEDYYGVTRSSMHDEFEILEPFENQRVQKNAMVYIIDVVCSIAIFGGVFTNILAFVVLVRSRLWLKHEGYIYLAAIFCVNVGILSFCTSSFWMTSVYEYYGYYPPNTSVFMCKVWHFFITIFFASGWLSVALLLNVYLREQLIRRRRCGCPLFAAKYCTLFATKIIVGVIFGVLFVLGIPHLAIYEFYPEEEGCYPSQPKSVESALLVETILMYALPFLFYVPLLFSMLCKNGQGIIVGSSEAEQKSISDDQMRAMAVTLSSATLFSYFGRVLLYFETGRALMASIYIQIELMFGMSLALQPIFCFVILKGLRDGFRSQLKSFCCCCCRRQLQPLDRGEEVVQYIAIQEDPPNPTGS